MFGKYVGGWGFLKFVLFYGILWFFLGCDREEGERGVWVRGIKVVLGGVYMGFGWNSS